MANFLLIEDPDPVRRKAASLRAHARIAFIPELSGSLVSEQNYALVWAAAPQAPVHHAAAISPGGSHCILLGEPHDETGRLFTTADFQRRHDVDWAARNELNGFYAAVLLHPEHGVRAEADVLGMFPIYHWKHGDVLLIASSPALFPCHPEFAPSLDLHGIAALLLTSGMVGGRTLWQQVRRLSADHVLLSTGTSPVRELAPPPLFGGVGPETVDEAVEHAAGLHRSFLQAALQRSTAPGLQLSGGLDSRLLAGFAVNLQLRPACLTFGRHRDLDAHCARQVARELNLPQLLHDADSRDYAAFAQASVEWEQLSGGLYALPMGWNISVHRPAVTMDRMICGLTLDAVIGGPKNVAPASDQLSFEQLRIGGLGFDRTRLAALIGHERLLRACDDVRDEVVQFYLAAGPDDHLREWSTNLAHRHRFAVGACAWRYALFAWPVMPALDRRLIRFAATLPFPIVKQRQIQTRMLISQFPRLARLELDRNYLDTAPLVGTQPSLAYDVRRRTTKLARKARAWIGPDPRFYVRTMDFNGPGWRAVRALTDDASPTTNSIFRREAMAHVIPPSNVTLRNLRDPIIDSAPLKNALGLQLWMRQYA